MCALQRPLDDKTQLRVAIEADAILALIALRESGQIELVSSFAHRFENDNNPHRSRREFASGILRQAGWIVERGAGVEAYALVLVGHGIKPLDALHLACAVESEADYFCTCDDRLLKKARGLSLAGVKVVSPLELIAEIEP